MRLKTIADMGFVSYFLIVWDFINHAKSIGVPVGPGRGSAAGSLVSLSVGDHGSGPDQIWPFIRAFYEPGAQKHAGY